MKRSTVGPDTSTQACKKLVLTSRLDLLHEKKINTGDKLQFVAHMHFHLFRSVLKQTVEKILPETLREIKVLCS